MLKSLFVLASILASITKDDPHMRRADRLFQIIQHLRGRKLTTARWLAEKLEVSERTIYRDIQDLMSTGVPIDGEAGLGYILRKTYDLPPLMFDANELTTLVLGARMVASLGGTMKTHAEQVLSKLNAALPDQAKKTMDSVPVYVPNDQYRQYGAVIDTLNRAICQQSIVTLAYQKPDEIYASERQVYPLGVYCWQTRWILMAWCTRRQDFRQFRLDRMIRYHIESQTFTLEKSQHLDVYLNSLTKNIFKLKNH